MYLTHTEVNYNMKQLLAEHCYLMHCCGAELYHNAYVLGMISKVKLLP